MSCLINLRHPIAMRRQLRFVYSFSPHVSPARHIHSRRRFYLEQLSCPGPRMRCAACLPHSAVLPHVYYSLRSSYHTAARNERSNVYKCIIFPARVRCAACLPYSTVTHAPPAVAGCPSCLAQTYESLAHAQRPPVAADHGALVECGSCCICKFLWRDESDCMCVVVQGPQASG